MYFGTEYCLLFVLNTRARVDNFRIKKYKNNNNTIDARVQSKLKNNEKRASFHERHQRVHYSTPYVNY